jgi:hypothetical protein
MRIAIYIHPDLSRAILDAGADGARALGRLSRQAIAVTQNHGEAIAYAPAILPDGQGCAMSVRQSRTGLIVEIDPPGTALKGIGVVKDARNKKR